MPCESLELCPPAVPGWCPRAHGLCRLAALSLADAGPPARAPPCGQPGCGSTALRAIVSFLLRTDALAPGERCAAEHLPQPCPALPGRPPPLAALGTWSFASHLAVLACRNLRRGFAELLCPARPCLCPSRCRVTSGLRPSPTPAHHDRRRGHRPRRYRRTARIHTWALDHSTPPTTALSSR